MLDCELKLKIISVEDMIKEKSMKISIKIYNQTLSSVCCIVNYQMVRFMKKKLKSLINFILKYKKTSSKQKVTVTWEE